MATIVYEIAKEGEEWGVRRAGVVTTMYATKEAAFEAATTAASTPVREGHNVVITVQGNRTPETGMRSDEIDGAA